jgi:CRISPR-associated protein Cas1
MKSKTKKIFLDDSGEFLGRGEGCLIVSNRKHEVEKYPLFENEIGEVQIKMGNSVSSGALATLAFWGIDTLITTQRGAPVGYLRAIDDDSHVKTRVCQYEAIKSGRAIEIAKKLVMSKILGQNQLLKKYGLRQHDLITAKQTIDSIKMENINVVRNKLTSLEGKFTDRYFQQIFPMLPHSVLKVEKRRTFKAYDGINNTFNLAYTVLKWKVHKAIIKAKLEPFLGFLHSEQFSKPSLVCDLMETYRFLIDDFLIQFSKSLGKKDFAMVQEDFSSKKKGKREYLSKPLAKELMTKLNAFFETTVEIPRMKYGNRQEIETLLSEEALLLAKYLRNERKDWQPRVPIIC